MSVYRPLDGLVHGGGERNLEGIVPSNFSPFARRVANCYDDQSFIFSVVSLDESEASIGKETFTWNVLRKASIQARNRHVRQVDTPAEKSQAQPFLLHPPDIASLLLNSLAAQTEESGLQHGQVIVLWF